MNFAAVLEWVKANVFIVVFSVIIIAAPIALWFVSSGMNAAVKAEVNKRAGQYPILANLEKGVDFGPELGNSRGVINDDFLTKYGEYAEKLGKDADLVTKSAVAHNRDHHTVAMDGVLPTMPETQREVLPKKFWEALMGNGEVEGAYQRLLRDINAGAPPTLESMREEIERVHVQFITQTLQKGDLHAALTDEETKSLAERLTSVRLGQCIAVADKTTLYVSQYELGVPEWVQSSQPSHGQLYTWQWQFWIIDDILRALHAANTDDQSVHRAPVKRVMSLAILNLPGVSGGMASPSAAAGGGGGRLSSAAGGGGGGGSGRASEGAGAGGGLMTPEQMEAMEAGSGAAPIEAAAMPDDSGGVDANANAKAPVPLDYSASFTGRKTNPLYDVINVQLILIVETARLPKVLDMLARQNFISVTALTLEPADAFEAARDGYFYGGQPVSQVSIQLETIWLREWMTPFMPNDVKKALNISNPPPAPGAGATP